MFNKNLSNKMQENRSEYLKQRERLKYVTANCDRKKVLDPDTMIEQLISDKDTFKFNTEPQLPYNLPKWLKVSNNLAPAVYDQIWQKVKLPPSHQLCNTHVLTQFFSTSGLSFEELGFLWSLTNVFCPGFLTQQELYVMLALIALVQTGYNVKDTSIIENIYHPIIPQLNYTFLNITVANVAVNKNINNNSLKNSTNDDSFNCNIPSGFVSTAINENNNPPYTINIPDSYIGNNYLHNDLPLLKGLNKISLNDINISNVDIKFVIPETKKTDIEFDILDVEKLTPELNVDIPINNHNTRNVNTDEFHDFGSFIGSQSLPITSNEIQKNTANTNFTSTAEPMSLNLSEFKNETSMLDDDDDDDFSDFQSAVILPEPVSTVPSLTKIDYNNETNNIPNPALSTNSNVIDSLEIESNLKSTITNDIEDTNEDAFEYQTSNYTDKYDVFRSLVQDNEEIFKTDTNVQGDDGEDEFSDFHTATIIDTKPQTKEEMKLTIKRKCLEASLRLLQDGLTTFVNITNETTIREVLSDERGYKYLNQLKIVYETSQRFQRRSENEQLNDALQTTWGKLISFSKYLPNEDLLENACEADVDADASTCKLCETKCDVNCVRYAGNYYHVSCINLFLHFVEDAEISAMLNL